VDTVDTETPCAAYRAVAGHQTVAGVTNIVLDHKRCGEDGVCSTCKVLGTRKSRS